MAEPVQSDVKPMGWLVGLGVLLITLGVVAGLIGIALVAKRKQKYRIPASSTNSIGRLDTDRARRAIWIQAETLNATGADYATMSRTLCQSAMPWRQ
jgi:hypothetical protein